MTDITITIFIGVLSGVMTSGLIWTAVKIFNKIIIPWYQQSIYRGIDISGEWTSKKEYLGKVMVDQTIQISQKGHRISGSLISRNKIPSKGEDTTSFFIEGEIFDNYVDIEYKTTDKKFIGRGSFLLKVKEGGEKLAGGLVAIDRFSTDIMTSQEIEWKRKITN
jgi:hypothetical protein